MAKNPKRDVRIRLQGNHAELYRRIKEGKEDLSKWDTEELVRGYKRSKDGSFRGVAPAAIPREVHDELARRVKMDVAHQLRGLAAVHIQPVLKEILTEDMMPEDVPGLKLKAQVAQDLLDRFVLGKTEQVEITGTMKHESLIDKVSINRNLDELEDPDIIDAEVVDDDDEFGDDWEDE